MHFLVYFNGEEREYIESITAKDWNDAEAKAKILACGEFFTLKFICD